MSESEICGCKKKKDSLMVKKKSFIHEKRKAVRHSRAGSTKAVLGVCYRFLNSENLEKFLIFAIDNPLFFLLPGICFSLRNFCF